MCMKINENLSNHLIVLFGWRQFKSNKYGLYGLFLIGKATLIHTSDIMVLCYQRKGSYIKLRIEPYSL